MLSKDKFQVTTEFHKDSRYYDEELNNAVTEYMKSLMEKGYTLDKVINELYSEVSYTVAEFKILGRLGKFEKETSND